MPTEKVYKTDEITFKEALVTFKEYWSEVKRYWWLMVLICIPFVAFGLYSHLTMKLKYPAELTFMINEDSGSSMGALAGVLGQFGLGSSGDENLDKILELSKSMNISLSTFFRSLKIDGKQDLLANHIIQMLEDADEWNNSSLFGKVDSLNLEGFRFTHDSIPLFSLLESKALKRLHQHLIGNKNKEISPLLESEVMDGSGIMKMTSKTYDPEISVAICNNLYTNLRDYYIEKSIEKQQTTYQILESKTDSILSDLKDKEYALANFKDRNQGLFAKTDQLTEVRLSRDVQKLSMMYAEATKNKELADFALQDNTPFIQLIDQPFLPIAPEKSSIVKRLFSAIILGLFIGLFLIISRKMFRDALK